MDQLVFIVTKIINFNLSSAAFRRDDTRSIASIRKVSSGGETLHLKSTEKDIVMILLDSKLGERFFLKVRHMHQQFKTYKQSLLDTLLTSKYFN